MKFDLTFYTALFITITLSVLIHSLQSINYWISPAEQSVLSQTCFYGVEILFIPMGLIFLAFYIPQEANEGRAEKAQKIFYLLASYTIIAVPTALASHQLSPQLKDLSLKRFGQRNNIVIDAVESFNSNNGHYPKHLNELVPMYLPEIPSKYLRTTVDYRIDVDESDARSWSLKMKAQIGFSEDAYFVYRPNQNFLSTPNPYGKWKFIGIN